MTGDNLMLLPKMKQQLAKMFLFAWLMSDYIHYLHIHLQAQFAWAMTNSWKNLTHLEFLLAIATENVSFLYLFLLSIKW